ncbi:MAG: hypothetical protein M1816_007394 [Peltula sp. TS41687]|nr:MAG: hypothetical protein M1816_007394 [Peltula sp. TS41687]
MARFNRLVRFLAHDKRIYHGDALLPSGVTDLGRCTQAKIIKGDIFGEHEVTDEIIYKPLSTLAGPNDPIPIPHIAQGPGLDYECELVAIIGREGRDISAANAGAHILGYCVGNDVSHREWQLTRGGGQWSLGKGFDGWAPIGPGIVSAARVMPDPHALKISTSVNGTKVQDSCTADMIFGVHEIVRFLSQGTTLLPGDVVFTGTPEGVGAARKPPLWLGDGDLVEVELEGVGRLRNRVEFVKDDRSRL